MQGFNMGRYVPPEYEGTISANKLAGKHALGNRARKAGQGILTVRFEMPYAIWCTTCPKETIIGQGVRFNAEKKKVGSYYSTPIYSFRMKHSACGGWIEIHTDPKNTAYVVVEGAKKRESGDDIVREGDIQLRSDQEKERLRNDAFAALEVTIDDRKQAKADKSRIDGLIEAKERDWDDPYSASQRLRKTFRVERKQREKKQAATEDLKNRMSLGLDLLEESAEDSRKAALVDFGDLLENSEDFAAQRAKAKTLFHAQELKSKISREANLPTNPKSVKAKFYSKVDHNTRAALDPFLVEKASSSSPAISGVKRKRDSSKDAGLSLNSSEEINAQAPLVDYESD